MNASKCGGCGIVGASLFKIIINIKNYDEKKEQRLVCVNVVWWLVVRLN